MEDQITVLLQSIQTYFPLVQFESIDNLFSSTLKHFIVKENKNIKGFASSHDPLLVIQKAYSEFIERKVLSVLNISFRDFKTSNGFAAHLDSKNAHISSRNEIIERDALLVSWHSKTAPYWLSFNDIKIYLKDENLSIYNLHLQHKLNLRLGLLATSRNILTAIACVEFTDNKYSFYVDCKSGVNLSELINSLIESVTFHSHYIIKGYKEKLLPPTVKQVKDPMDHFNYYMLARKNVAWFLKGSERVFEFLSESITSYDCYAQDLLGVNNLNRFVCFSESHSMQDYYCGKLTKKNYNKSRFEKLFGRSFKPNEQIHPLS